MKIDFANLQYQYQLYKEEIDLNIKSVLNKSNYIMGEEIETLENDLKKFTGANHAITCSNGTDALLIAMMALGVDPGDEIITTPFTFISTVETIALLKAKPVFVDIEEDTYNIDANKIESAITSKTKIIMPVSLYGQTADLSRIQEIADKHKLKVIIDGAQSFGATYKGVCDSNLGDISTTSFFPAKPLGCYGDGGAIFTNNNELAEKMKMIRVHGQNQRYHHKYIGVGGRLDTIQAAILLAKLPHYRDEIKERQRIADLYNSTIQGKVIKPIIKPNRTSVWAQYTLRSDNRSSLQQKLKENGIPTAVHYPIPLHRQECFKYLNYLPNDFPVSEVISNEVISLPMNAFLKDTEINYIAKYVY